MSLTDQDILGAAGSNGNTVNFGDPKLDPKVIAQVLSARAGSLLAKSQAETEDDPKWAHLAECTALLMLVQSNMIVRSLAAQQRVQPVTVMPRISLT